MLRQIPKINKVSVEHRPITFDLNKFRYILILNIQIS